MTTSKEHGLVSYQVTMTLARDEMKINVIERFVAKNVEFDFGMTNNQSLVHHIKTRKGTWLSFLRNYFWCTLFFIPVMNLMAIIA